MTPTPDISGRFSQTRFRPKLIEVRLFSKKLNKMRQKIDSPRQGPGQNVTMGIKHRTASNLRGLCLLVNPVWIDATLLEGLAMGLSKRLVGQIQFHLEEKWLSC